MRLVFILLALLGCSSGEKSSRFGSGSTDSFLMPYSDENSRAPAEAFSGDVMYTRRPMPHRPDPKPWEFYYKHCSTNGNSTFYSKTSYDCSGPYY